MAVDLTVIIYAIRRAFMIPINASKNQAIIVALFVILTSTTIAPSQMASAQITFKSTLTSALITTTKASWVEVYFIQLSRF